ncbi:glycine cleavage system H protein [bacterium BMS3Bbin02]|nr:glycine cleavage system H protein [bacterium BMS3Bbin02]
MSEVRGCNLPEDLYYWPEKHVWVAPQEDGSVVVGVTDVAQSLAHAIISALPKKVGRPAKKARSLGTIESGKWVGPVTAPVSGEILETNPLLVTNPGIINTDPYGEGWYMKIMPADWDADRADLVTGPNGIAAYQAFLETEGIECE